MAEVTNTLKDILEPLAQKTSPGLSPIAFTPTGGSTTTIIDTGAEYNKTSTTAYDGIIAVVTEDGGGSQGAPEAEAKLVTNWASGTQTWTTEAFTVAPASGDSVCFLQGLSLENYLRAINDTILNLPLERWLPASLDADGDMERTADWGSAVSGGTGDKETTAADTVLRRSQNIVGAGDGQGQRGDAYDVFEGETLYFDVAINCTTGTVQVELFDVGASAVITGTQYTTDDLGTARVRFDYNVGADVESISVQVTQDGATALDCNLCWVSVLSDRRTYYDLPSGYGDLSNIKELEYLPEGSTFENDSSYLFETILRPLPLGKGIRDYHGANPNRVQITTPHLGPVFVRFNAPDGALSVMTGTATTAITAAPLQALLHGAEARIWEMRAAKASTEAFSRDYKRWQMEAMRAYRSELDALGLNVPDSHYVAQRRIMARTR